MKIKSNSMLHLISRRLRARVGSNISGRRLQCGWGAFRFLTVMLLPIVAVANEHRVDLGDDLKLPAIITTSKMATLELDLSEFEPAQTVYAGLRVKVQVNDDCTVTPMLGLYDASSGALLSRLYTHLKKSRYYVYDLTEAVNSQLSAGKSMLPVQLGLVAGTVSDPELTLSRVQFYLADVEAHRLSHAQMVTPFWQTGQMWGETVFPYSERFPVLMQPEADLKVYNGLRTTTYPRENFLMNGREMLLTYEASQSLDLIVPDSELFPADLKSAKGRAFKSRSGGYLLSPEGTWFQTHQLSIDYTFDRDSWQGPKPAYQPELLPKTLAKIEKGDSLKVMLYGDSISMGANATALAGEPPYQWSWGQLIVDTLQARSQGAVSYINAALGGTTAEWGEENAESLLVPHRPDLVILAFGMNGSITPAEFGRMTESMMATVRRSNPDVEFILVHAMQPNKDFKPLNLYQSYGAVLEAMQEPGVLFADVWSMHGALIESKRYVDMTANHVNHPNDFLIRVYAQVILSRFVSFD
ncbi:SGNH/GDSL hydrolase family protein [Coraliomargarita sp. W4R53]